MSLLCCLLGMNQIHGVLLYVRNDPVCQTFKQTMVELVVGYKIWQISGVGCLNIKRLKYVKVITRSEILECFV